MKRWLWLVILAGCATTDPKLAEEAARPVPCATKQECDVYWQRAQIWITKNSPYRIQVVTDTVLSTYGPSGLSSPGPGYSLARVPNGTDGAATIEVSLQCPLAGFECSYPDEVASLKRYMVGQ